mmetsp:Transcript_25790/g.47422  ORF Transcript_25790/g.47422 Transcript_25790/m.47422 type:complete len:106 (+) Transcript_25790:134-451(+)
MRRMKPIFAPMAQVHSVVSVCSREFPVAVDQKCAGWLNAKMHRAILLLAPLLPAQPHLRNVPMRGSLALPIKLLVAMEAVLRDRIRYVSRSGAEKLWIDSSMGIR